MIQDEFILVLGTIFKMLHKRENYEMNNLKILFTLLIIININPIFGQIRLPEFKLHDRGLLWETMKDDGTIGAPNPTNPFEYYPSMDWPGGPHEHPFKQEQRSYMVGSGLWIGGSHQDGTLFFTENGPLGRVDEGIFEEIIKVENYLGSAGYDPNEAEEIITADFVTSENIRVQRMSRSWGFIGINNFIMIEYIFTNKNTANIDNVYFGFPYLIRPSYQDVNVHNGWGDDSNRSDELVDYDSSRALLYSFDDTPNFDLPTDIGNWWGEVNELRTPGYAGFAFLHIDAASDASKQPSNVFYAQLLDNTNKLTLNSTSKENLYAILNGTEHSLQMTAADRIVPFMLMSCGPYNMAPSGQVRIVLVEAVDGLPIEDVIDITAENVFTAQGDLPEGLSLLQNTIDRAQELFDNNYQLDAVPPPSPDIEVIPIPTDKSISISWSEVESTWVNPISGLEDFREYRIYRSERSFAGPYERIIKIRPGVASHRDSYFDEQESLWVYKDEKIQLGVSYYYSVTSRDVAGEESFFTNRNEEPIRSTNEPAENALNVSVFPNPFREVSGFPTTGEENSIVWINLPAECIIRIYTSSGEEVRKLEHNNPNSGEEVWDQLNNARQKTAPGIYYWTVTSDVGQAKGTLLLIK